MSVHVKQVFATLNNSNNTIARMEEKRILHECSCLLSPGKEIPHF